MIRILGLVGAVMMLGTFAEEQVVEAPVITIEENKHGEIKGTIYDSSLVFETEDLSAYEKETATAGDYYFITLTAEENYLYKEDSLSVGVENVVLTKYEENVYYFILENKEYTISAKFSLDIKGIVDKYAEQYGLNDMWSTYVAPLIGGVSIGTVIAFLCNLIFTYVQKSDLKLGNRNFKATVEQIVENTKVYTDKASEYISIANKTTDTAIELINQSKIATEEAKKTANEVKVIKDQVYAILTGLSDYFNHDSNAVANGTARKLNDAITALKELDMDKGATTNGKENESE